MVDMSARLSLTVAPEVQAALDAGRPVVALESTIISHGLPRPRNLEVALELEAMLRAAGVVPASVGVPAGRPTVGRDDGGLVGDARPACWDPRLGHRRDRRSPPPRR